MDGVQPIGRDGVPIARRIPQATSAAPAAIADDAARAVVLRCESCGFDIRGIDAKDIFARAQTRRGEFQP
jgi:hypothetical protein